MVTVKVPLNMEIKTKTNKNATKSNIQNTAREWCINNAKDWISFIPHGFKYEIFVFNNDSDGVAFKLFIGV